MPPWLSLINSYQNIESSLNSSRWVQLATVCQDNTPRVRTVVFRGWSDSYEMKILTDKRSNKFSELENNKNAEICWFFTKSLCQFRLSGTSSIDFGEDTIYHWNQLDTHSRSMWGWPSPGKKYYSNKNSITLTNENTEILENFCLLKIRMSQVDQLILGKQLHFRRHWIFRDHWVEERLNP